MHMKNIKKVVIPVAGFGTRFLPASKSIPKEMFPIIDKPLIHFCVEEAIQAGIQDIIFVISRSKNSVIDYFDHAPELEMELEKKGKKTLLYPIKNVLKDRINYFFVRQKKLSGVGDAVLCAEKIISNEPFAIMFPDDLIKSKKGCLSSMVEIYNTTDSSVVAVERVLRKDVNKYGIVSCKTKKDKIAEISSIEEKPEPQKAKSNLGVVGRFILNPGIFKILKKTKPGHGNEIQLTDAINSLAKNQRVLAYQFDGTRYDCGSKLGFFKATLSFAKDHPDIKRDFKKILIKNEF